ncbi:hypothetical protein [uncultured Caulobacter sp.]|uniref:hypothetical protein n=1 Tax=uncultured Caulobacter sp. TaxID=158749 RepID=UPI00260993A3|nr:hypothetical protein [uncultured Caulobacter sp.]
MTTAHSSMYENHRTLAKPKRSRGLSSEDFTNFACMFYVLLHYILLAFAYRYSPSLLDEITAVLALPFAISYVIRSRDVLPVFFFLLYALFLYLGAISNQLGGVLQPQSGLIAILLDAKIAVFALAMCYIFSNSKDPERIISSVLRTMIIIAIINTPFMALDYLRKSDIHGEILQIKSGFIQPRGLFHHPTELAWLYTFSAFYMAYQYSKRRTSMNMAGVICFSLLAILCVSIKEIFALLLGNFLIIRMQRRERFDIGMRIIAASLIAMGGFLVATSDFGAAVLKHVGMFWGESSIPTVRAGMTDASWRIASDFFPLGSGGGAFGSAPSYQGGYSNVYYAYNIHLLWGGSREYAAFLQDVFWPKIIAEGGWIGGISYIAFLGVFLLRIFQTRKKGERINAGWLRVCQSFIFLALLVSLASAPFTNELILFMTALAFGYAGRKQFAAQPLRS